MSTATLPQRPAVTLVFDPTPPCPGGRNLLTAGRFYVGNDVTHATLLDRACACSYENLPKYRSYRVSNMAPLSAGYTRARDSISRKSKRRQTKLIRPTSGQLLVAKSILWNLCFTYRKLPTLVSISTSCCYALCLVSIADSS